jgi:hypothetical protein
MASFIGRRITASRMGGHAHRVSAIPVAGHALIGFLRRCPAKIRFRYFTSTRSIRLGSSAGARELFTRLDTGHPHHPNQGSIAMSHHLDTPLAAQNGQLYIDDLYVFSGDASTVFIMGVNSNITEIHVKPGFHHEARYEFKVHFDGADFETLTYRVSFDERDSQGRISVMFELTSMMNTVLAPVRP